MLQQARSKITIIWTWGLCPGKRWLIHGIVRVQDYLPMGPTLLPRLFHRNVNLWYSATWGFSSLKQKGEIWENCFQKALTFVKRWFYLCKGTHTTFFYVFHWISIKLGDSQGTDFKIIIIKSAEAKTSRYLVCTIGQSCILHFPWCNQWIFFIRDSLCCKCLSNSMLHASGVIV